MITEIFHVFEKYTEEEIMKPEFSFKNPELCEFQEKLETHKHLMTLVADQQGLNTFVYRVQGEFYIEQVDNSYVDEDLCIIEEEYRLWKCDNMEDVINQLVDLNVFDYEDAIRYMFDGMEERNMFGGNKIVQSRIPISGNTSIHQLNYLEDELKRVLNWVNEQKERLINDNAN